MQYNIRLYQVNKQNENILFMRYDFLKQMNIKVDVNKMYNKVYEKAFESKSNVPIPHIDLLNKLYEIFQFCHPYKGHSVSVSDIIAIDNFYYYVDSFGFKLISK